MSDVPKFVLKRLPENAALETHPDADLLTGFVEMSLLEPERNRVTEHLARCSACRAVVALAMPESPELEVPALTTSSNARRRDWFNPAVLRWVVATAGIVAVTSVGILQYRSHQNKIADDNILLARNAAPPSVPPADQAPLVPSQPLPVPPEAKKRQPTDSREKVQPSRPEPMATGGSTGSSIKMLRTPPVSHAASAPGAAVASGYAGARVSAAPPPPSRPAQKTKLPISWLRMKKSKPRKINLPRIPPSSRRRRAGASVQTALCSVPGMMVTPGSS